MNSSRPTRFQRIVAVAIPGAAILGGFTIGATRNPMTGPDTGDALIVAIFMAVMLVAVWLCLRHIDRQQRQSEGER